MLIFACAIAIAIILIFWSQRERFTSRREKAAAISSWLKTDSSPTYREFAQKFPSSDIVDYHSVRKAGAVEAAEIEKVVS